MKILTLLVIAGLMTFNQAPVFAQTWIQAGAPVTNWTCVASSPDGTKLVATMAPGGIFISTNAGAAWIRSASAPTSTYQWSSIACSADGTRLVATSDSIAPAAAFPGWVYYSTNSGSNWIQSSAPGGIANWTTSVIAANGMKMMVADYSPGLIYASTNSGVNWYSNNLPKKGWSRLAASADCVCVAAAVYGGGIYTTTNFGGTWITNNVPNKNWSCITSSADGAKLAALVYGGGIYVSTNGGRVWTQTAAPVKNWQAIASTADGNSLAAAIRSGGIYFSTNSGTTWTQTSASTTNWTSIAFSADGSRCTAVATPGGIFTCYQPKAPVLSMLPGNNRVTLAWTVPATNFLLQQSTNLKTWSNLTNVPLLNLTNLQNQTVLPQTNRSGFFRLKGQ